MAVKLKTKSDFSTKEEYHKYIQTQEFYDNYNIFDKSIDELMDDMLIYSDWREYVEQAMEYIKNNPPGWRQTWDAFSFYGLMEDYVEMSCDHY